MPETINRSIVGTAQLRRVGRVQFPVEELVGPDGVLAQLGRDGSLRIFLGPGRRVQLSDGTEWRIKATTRGRHIVPIILADDGKVAVSSPLFARHSYGLNGKGYGLALIPTGRVGVRRPSDWFLRSHGTDVASIEGAERRLTAHEPLPISAALLAFTLITHGIPGEANLVPAQD